VRRYVIVPEIAKALIDLNITRPSILELITQGNFKYQVNEDVIIAAMIELKSHLSDLKQFLVFSKEARVKYDKIGRVYQMLKDLL